MAEAKLHVSVCEVRQRGSPRALERQGHHHQLDPNLVPYLSAVISHFEDGRLPGNLLAISLLCAALVLGVRVAPQTCVWWVEAACQPEGSERCSEGAEVTPPGRSPRKLGDCSWETLRPLRA